MPESPPPESRDTGYAPPAWTFDSEVTRVFDDMLRRSIPDYAAMRQLVTDLAVRHVRDGTMIDLGCSRGEQIARVLAVPTVSGGARFLGVDVSEPMIEAARQTLAGPIADGRVRIARHDLREGCPPHPGVLTPEPPATVVTSVLTLMFVPLEHRLRLVTSIHQRLANRGVLVLVEKVIGAAASIDELMVERYYAFKRENGYTQEEIDRKRLSLEGRLVPVTAAWNAEMLRVAGFAEVDCFWRWMNFAGWIAVK